MSITFEAEANLAVCRVSGTLGKAELETVQSECEQLIARVGEIKMLVLLENFSGWEKTDGWEDTSFTDRNDDHIDKMAIVGDPAWKDQVDAFTLKGLRPTPIEYFDSGDEAAARQWLEQP